MLSDHADGLVLAEIPPIAPPIAVINGALMAIFGASHRLPDTISVQNSFSDGSCVPVASLAFYYHLVLAANTIRPRACLQNRARTVSRRC